MSEYSRIDANGDWVQVYDLDKCLKAIKCRVEDNEKTIKFLRAENEKLRNDHYKDEEMERMKSELDNMKKDYYRGFPITEEEEKSIKEWMKKHDEADHGYTTDELKYKANGVSGGRYSYHFTPTSLGVSGVVRCTCGTEFEFQKIG